MNQKPRLVGTAVLVALTLSACIAPVRTVYQPAPVAPRPAPPPDAGEIDLVPPVPTFVSLGDCEYAYGVDACGSGAAVYAQANIAAPVDAVNWYIPWAFGVMTGVLINRFYAPPSVYVSGVYYHHYLAPVVIQKYRVVTPVVVRHYHNAPPAIRHSVIRTGPVRWAPGRGNFVGNPYGHGYTPPAHSGHRPPGGGRPSQPGQPPSGVHPPPNGGPGHGGTPPSGGRPHPGQQPGPRPGQPSDHQPGHPPGPRPSVTPPGTGQPPDRLRPAPGTAVTPPSQGGVTTTPPAAGTPGNTTRPPSGPGQGGPATSNRRPHSPGQPNTPSAPVTPGAPGGPSVQPPSKPITPSATPPSKPVEKPTPRNNERVMPKSQE